MKSLELARAMIRDSALAEYGDVYRCEPDGVSLRDFFGANRHEGELENGTLYFYFYCEDFRVFSLLSEPDVKITDDNYNTIWLWKIEG